MSVRSTIIQRIQFFCTGCYWSLSCSPIGRSTIIQKIRFFTIEYKVVSFLVVGLLDGLQSFKEYFLLALCMSLLASQYLVYWTVYNHSRKIFFLYLICNCRYGLQSFQGCVSSALNIQLSVSRSLVHWALYNNSRNAIFLYQVCNDCYWLQVSGLSDGAANKQQPASCLVSASAS